MEIWSGNALFLTISTTYEYEYIKKNVVDYKK